MAKKHHSNTRTESHQSGSKSSGGGVSVGFTDSLRKKGPVRDGFPDALQSTTVSTSLFSIVHLLLRSLEKHYFH